MSIFRFLKPLAFVLLMASLLAACDSAEERAEKHFQSGLALMEEGDYDRAMVEFRNVFELNGSHQEARHKLAEILLQHKNNPRSAYSQYLRLAEQYPDDLDARINLTEIAFQGGEWEEMDRHGTRAEELAPDNLRVQAIAVARAYRTAVLEENAPAWREQARTARTLLDDLPESTMLRSVAMDGSLRDGDTASAMQMMDQLLESDPDNLLYWRQRLGMLAQLNDMEKIEAQLREMVQRFPDDIENKQALLQFYMSRDQSDEAENFLRAQLDTAAAGDPGPRADLITFLLQVRGTDVARTELASAIAEEANPVPFQNMLAAIDFASGEQTKAVAALEAIVEGAESTEETRATKISLARMLASMGNEVGARTRVEEVLAEAPENIDALKMQATWQIRADDTDTAINNLRMALDTAPEDVQAMTLMAEAYLRSGRPELHAEFLALAADASGNAPAESIRYANVLIEAERYLPAEDVLIPALRLAPRNPDLLSLLGTLYLRMEDTARTEQVITSLRAIEDNPEAARFADGLQADLISRQNGVGEAVSYLESIANAADATLSDRVQLVRARLATGDAEAALDLSRTLLGEDPDNQVLQAMTASVEAASGNLEAAAAMYRDVLAENGQIGAIWLQLAQVEQRLEGGVDGAAVIAEGLSVLPEDPNLLWASASYKEQAGDVNGAIEIYETLYERNSGSVVVANNLASLLSTYRQDEESLTRAWTVARRFRDTDIPAMQDTFGWILHRRGESAEALPYLEAAAQGLPNDALVQYHLGAAYQTLARPDDALAQFRKAVQIAGPDDQRAQIVEARSIIAGTSAPEGTVQSPEN